MYHCYDESLEEVLNPFFRVHKKAGRVHNYSEYVKKVKEHKLDPKVEKRMDKFLLEIQEARRAELESRYNQAIHYYTNGIKGL